MDNGREARIQVEASDNRDAAMMVCLHRRAWLALGWDPLAQSGEGNYEPPEIGDERRVFFTRQTGGVTVDGTIVLPPSDDYWTAVFRTWPDDWETNLPTGSTTPGPVWEADNDGNTRHYRALYPEGTVVLDHDRPTVVKVAVGSVYCQGQLAQPPADDAEIDGNACNRSGWWIFRGTIQREGDEEAREFMQVAKASWVDSSDGYISEDDDGDAALYIERWEDPRIFGLPFRRMSNWWVATNIECAPMAVLGGHRIDLDPAWEVISRLLLASGTASAWADESTPPAQGKNKPSGATGQRYWGGDLEGADLGLGLPAAMVDYESFAREALELPGGPSGALALGKQGFVGPVETLEALKGLLAARGWALGFRKLAGDKVPAFSLFTPFASVSAKDADITLTEADKAGEMGQPESWVPEQTLRFESPIDKITMQYRWDPAEGSRREEKQGRSHDPGARGRPGTVTYEVENFDLVHPQDFLVSDGTQYQWTSLWSTRFEYQLANWYERRHFPLTARFSRPKGQFLYPGTIVRLTDPRPASPAGSYGLTSVVGRVLECVHHLRGKWAGSVTAKILVFSRSSQDARHFAGSARVYRWDSGASELLCSGPWGGDWLATKRPESDVETFDEPSWSDVGGTASAVLLQSEDGETWPSDLQVTLDVSSIDATRHAIAVTNVVGTIYRDTHKLLFLREYSDQASSSWVRSVFAVHTLRDGTFDGIQGWKLQP